MDHFIGHIPLLYKNGLKTRYNKSKSRVFEHFMTRAGEKKIDFRSPPKFICFAITRFPQLLIDYSFGRWETPLFTTYISKVSAVLSNRKNLDEFYV